MKTYLDNVPAPAKDAFSRTTQLFTYLSQMVKKLNYLIGEVETLKKYIRETEGR